MAWILLIHVLFSGACLAQHHHRQPRTIPHHLHGDNPRFFVESDSDGVASMTTKIQPTSTSTRMDVEVSWKNAPMRNLGTSDWIGVFDQHLMEQFHAPISYRYVFSHGAKRADIVNHGSMNFSVPNLRSSYVFMYISGNQQFPQIIAKSEAMNFTSTLLPMGVHVAISSTDPHKMLVMWTQKSPKRPTLQWGFSADSLVNSVLATSDTYTKDDLCDTATSPAGRQGWFDPGLLMTAEVPVMAGATYYYKVGDPQGGWPSSVMNFTTAPAAHAGPTRLIILADMGNTPEDGSLQHSFDFQNHGELPSRNTSRLSKHLLDKKEAHAVVHIGDISYAVGYLSEWDQFMHQIEPVASRIPWMTSVGNHEMGWSKSDPFNGTLMTASDSGGECGVPFFKRFPFAMQPLSGGKATREADAWYSFNVGPVHFTMLSSEHNFAKGSLQWQWMVKDLEGVDRSLTPWVVVTSHRPMYVASSWTGDVAVMKLLSDNLEADLIKYGVDFFFSGHHHSYQRWCKLNGGKCVEERNGEQGIYHFVVGMAGYDHSRIQTTPECLVADAEHWGVTYWDFNETTASMQFIDGATEDVVDTFTYHKPAVKESEAERKKEMLI